MQKTDFQLISDRSNNSPNWNYCLSANLNEKSIYFIRSKHNEILQHVLLHQTENKETDRNENKEKWS